ncbi:MULTISPECIES: DMT family transporter [Paenibacillus]|uniref:Multidrug efflux SMR transporter n=1 Tax=Paenibacillus cucumis (ex Kampfer et al. 2016) TaxID=1776858 RepID=A0ABS7KG72_9BACL|nr:MULTISPECIES: multidrug efflux SMR transporter [Paenibacillus]MBY0203135.1 multidrug efflux SMR transporter [Paenibacillus cucumis (ex Kampfer et al. 2016)]MCK6078399.1 multidrug efflux SMR transporter [Paenibacillus silvae]MCK6152632.1 multidrug efflux SMR transporter [Paenibacillus silvae]MCK6271190.1 multidrug efflux SMR transporter [Paenibacillus silvae]MDT0125225.1 multidrug efflux SMR transporter [Paenibacillus sp. RRE4]
MSWFFLVIAGLMEVGGVISLKFTEGFSKLKPTILFIIFMLSSFIFLSVSLKEVPLSIGYGIWTGIGASGSVLLGMFVFKEPRNISKLIMVGGIIVSIVGLKLV